MGKYGKTIMKNCEKSTYKTLENDKK
jgi:hypothetical protein